MGVEGWRSYDERRVREWGNKMRGGGRHPDESERRDGMFCLLQFSLHGNIDVSSAST